ncbi:hypothetical protein CFIICLFH_3682 [Methylobacterium goesingense]|nr:hypothetical protein CFIICLFH_3682 [Methylobacterium goesingense]
MLNLKTLLELVARSRAESVVADALTPRGVGATASRTLLGTPEALWSHLAVRIDQARLVTCQGVARRVASTQKVLAITRTQGPIDPKALQDWIFAVLMGLWIRYGNRLEAVVLHRDGPRPVIVAVLVPTDPALRARRELDPGFREPAKRIAKAVPSDTVDVREATAPRKPANAEAIAIILPRGPAPLPVDDDASFEAGEPTRKTMFELMPTSPHRVRPGSERVPAWPGIEPACAARDPSLTWMASQDDRASHLGGPPRCQKAVSDDVGSTALSIGDDAEDSGFGFMHRAAQGQERHFPKQLRALRLGETFQVLYALSPDWTLPRPFWDVLRSLFAGRQPKMSDIGTCFIARPTTRVVQTTNVSRCLGRAGLPSAPEPTPLCASSMPIIPKHTGITVSIRVKHRAHSPMPPGGMVGTGSRRLSSSDGRPVQIPAMPMSMGSEQGDPGAGTTLVVLETPSLIGTSTERLQPSLMCRSRVFLRSETPSSLTGMSG